MPIISTRVGALPEFFTDDKNILFVEPGDIQQINFAISQISNDNLIVNKLGGKARQVYEEKLVLSLIIKQLRNAYKIVLN